MIRRISPLFVAAFLVLVGLSPIPVRAGVEPTIVESSVNIQFPSSIGFSLVTRSDEDIIDIRLRYRVERESYAQVTSEIYIYFTASTSVKISWSWDLRMTGGLPPGTIVYYWWLVTDAGGDRVETPPTKVEFSDANHEWRSISEGEVTLYWYEGGDSFAQELMAAAQEALERLYEDTGARLKKAVDLYIYASAQDLQGSMIFPQEWTGGVAFARYGTIAIGVAPYNLDWGKRAITHELTHLVTYQMTFNPYGDLPTWLNEGLSMYAEGEMEAVYKNYLAHAIASDGLISVRSLASPFSALAERSYLSYAESYSLVEFLINEYGQEKMFELLSTFAQGSSYDGALVVVYGFDMDVLNSLWRDYIMAPAEAGPGEGSEVHPNPALIGLVFLVAISALISVFWLWRQRW